MEKPVSHGNLRLVDNSIKKFPFPLSMHILFIKYSMKRKAQTA